MTPGEGAAKFEYIFPPFGVGDPSIYIYASKYSGVCLHSASTGGDLSRSRARQACYATLRAAGGAEPLTADSCCLAAGL